MTVLELFLIARNKEAKVADYLDVSNGCIHWNPSFIQVVHDWELESMDFFFLKDLYTTEIHQFQKKRVIWTLSKAQGFKVNTYYKALRRVGRHFPWRNVWRIKNPPCVSFFYLDYSEGEILTTNNLRERGIIILDWCSICKSNGETIDHLYLHCGVARERELWDLMCCLIGMNWVMPKRVLDLPSNWKAFW